MVNELDEIDDLLNGMGGSKNTGVKMNLNRNTKPPETNGTNMWAEGGENEVEEIDDMWGGAAKKG